MTPGYSRTAGWLVVSGEQRDLDSCFTVSYPKLYEMTERDTYHRLTAHRTSTDQCARGPVCRW